MYGNIVLFKPDRGFGFLRQADRLSDLFFHASEFAGDRGQLSVGALVEFSLGERKGKIVARDIRLLEAADAEVAPPTAKNVRPTNGIPATLGGISDERH